MKINSMIKFFPLLVVGLFVGCASADNNYDNITLDLAEIVTYEIENEPVSAKQVVAEQTTPAVLPEPEVELPGDLCFELNSTQLTVNGNQHLQEVVETLRENPWASIAIIGHTCNVGEESYNQWLSERRAETVRDILQQNYGINNPISVGGKGASEPKESNETRPGRQANRRVEVYIIK